MINFTSIRDGIKYYVNRYFHTFFSHFIAFVAGIVVGGLFLSKLF
jgi:hypothetical protein